MRVTRLLLLTSTRRGCPSVRAGDVGCLKTFGTFQQLEFHAFAFIQRAIAVLLDGGEVHEHIFTRGALNEAISLGSVEPLDCTPLFHERTPFNSYKESGRSLASACFCLLGSPAKEKARSSARKLTAECRICAEIRTCSSAVSDC